MNLILLRDTGNDLRGFKVAPLLDINCMLATTARMLHQRPAAPSLTQEVKRQQD